MSIRCMNSPQWVPSGSVIRPGDQIIWKSISATGLNGSMSVAGVPTS